MQRNDAVTIFDRLKDRIRAGMQQALANPLLHPSQREPIQRLLARTSFGYLEFAEEVPALNKRKVFGDPIYIGNAIRSKRESGLRLVPAAGTFGDLLSFRFAEMAADVRQFEKLSLLAQKQFGFQNANFFVLNAYPSGISLPEGIQSIECSAKPEVLALSLKVVREHFEKIILICQPHFLKYVIENGFLTGKDLTRLHFIIGGSWFPKGFLSQLARGAGVDSQIFQKRVISLFGVAEVGLGVGLQPAPLNAVRDALPATAGSLLSGTRSHAIPMLFFVDEDRFFVEAVDGRIFITAFSSKGTIPIIRYNTGDLGSVFSSDRLRELVPAYPFPDQAMFSIAGRVPDGDRVRIFADEIEEYICTSAPEKMGLTGDFLIKGDRCLFATKAPTADYPDILQELRKDLSQVSGIDLAPVVPNAFEMRSDLLRKPLKYAK